MAENKRPGIKHIIAVASGKGGVGKSTVAVNLALALQQRGLKVGLVDADVLGPSVPALLGIPYGQEPDQIGGQLLPVERLGIKTISMGMLTDHDRPAILRGPMVTKYMRLFVDSVRWGELDVLLLDMPPGTGDVQLTLAQAIPMTGALIVTTPQKVSLNIAQRGLRMFEKVNVRILGLVENMSGFACPHCHEETSIFSSGGAQALADLSQTQVLGRIPLDPKVVQGGDRGVPVVIDSPDEPVAKAYASIAEQLVADLEKVDAAGGAPAFLWQWASGEGMPAWKADAVRADGNPEMPIGIDKRDERTLAILWQDGQEHHYDLRDLRLACPCAHCIDEMTGKPLLDPVSIPLDVTPVRLNHVGQYAIAVAWNDGHSTGIYTFKRLRQIGERRAASAFEV